VGARDLRTLWGANATCQPLPFLSLERKERDDRAWVPGPVLATAPETHGPCSGPLVAKSLVYGSRLVSSWGDRASSSTRFNTYSCGSTHLGAARPGPVFFIVRVFEAWALGLGTWIDRDSVSKEVKVCDWGDNFKSDLGFRTSTDSTPARSACTRTPSPPALWPTYLPNVRLVLPVN
jgi:hypothetical protein